MGVWMYLVVGSINSLFSCSSSSLSFSLVLCLVGCPLVGRPPVGFVGCPLVGRPLVGFVGCPLVGISYPLVV